MSDRGHTVTSTPLEASPEKTPSAVVVPPISATTLDDASGPPVPASPVPLGVRSGVAVTERTDGESSPTSGTPSSSTSGTSSSADLLSSMVAPQIYQGPRVEVQADVVRRLEQTMVQHPNRFPSMIMYLGSVVMDAIPGTDEEVGAMSGAALLCNTRNSLPSAVNAIELSLLAGAADGLVENTLQTMVRARQFEYLRRSGIVGTGWSLIIEIHYTRERDSKPDGALHKDTLGNTLFVNLNYNNTGPMQGPEWIENPPPIADHDTRMDETLPPRFMSDVRATRVAHRDDPQGLVKTATLDQPYSMLAFVDEAIHHASPLVAHRRATPDALRDFLRTDADFSADYDAADAAWRSARPPTTSLSSTAATSSSPPPSFASAFARSDPDRWELLMGWCHGTTTVARPQLVDQARLSDRQVDRLHSHMRDGAELPDRGRDEGRFFNGVSIPPQARTDRTRTARHPIGPQEDRGSDGRQIPLTRQMSGLLRGGGPTAQRTGTSILGHKGTVTPSRSFFRTWVRAVPTGSVEMLPLPAPAPLAPAPSSTPEGTTSGRCVVQ